MTRAEAIAWAEAERKRSKEVPDMSLTIFGTMWADDGPVLRPHNPIQYEVRGLPSGHERVLIGQNLDVRPIRWRVLRTRDGVREWGKKDYETPGAALAALQAEFRESLETESER